MHNDRDATIIATTLTGLMLLVMFILGTLSYKHFIHSQVLHYGCDAVIKAYNIQE